MGSSQNDPRADMLYDLVKDIRKDLKDHDEAIKIDINEIKECVARQDISLEKYNNLLDIHIAGVDNLKQLHLDNARRIAMLEEPSIVFSTLKRWFIGLGAIAGAIYAIIKLLRI